MDWSRLEPARRVWLEDVGGDHRARLEFLADQGLRLVMADLCPGRGETLHFSHPRDNETLHLRAGGGKSLLPEAARYFPAASRWVELLYGGEDQRWDAPGHAYSLVRAGLLLEVEGGYIRRVRDAWRDCPQGALLGARAGQASVILERETGDEGAALHLSFAQALEEARGMKVPEAAVALRTALLELARAQAHLAWISEFASILGKRRAAAACDGLRLDLVAALEEWQGRPPGAGWAMPGGIREDFPVGEKAAVMRKLTGIAAAWKELSRRAASLTAPGWAERRLRGLGVEAEGSAWVGPLARAAGLERDARREEPGVYEAAGWESPAPPEGTGMLRRLLAIRAGEAASSLELAQRVLAEPLEAPLLTKRGRGGKGEGFGRCEGPDGEVCCHVLLDKGRVNCAAFSLPRELNRSAARVLAGCRLDEAAVLSLLWGS